MEFEELQKIWSKQENAPLYAINEETLYKRVQSRGKSTEFGLNLLEGGILLSSIVSLGSLYINWAGDDVPRVYYLLPIMLLIITGYVLALRRRRKLNAVRFEQTIIGELEKTIAHNEFLLARLDSMLWWYLLPVFGGFGVFFYLQQGPYWQQSIIAMVALAILSFVTIRWEIRKIHLPKQRDLKALRRLLTETSDQ